MVTLLRNRLRGVAASEFALALPAFLLVVMASAEVSHFITSVYTVQRAARDGARVGSVTLEGPSPDGTLIAARAEQQAIEVLEATGRTCGDTCQVDATWYQDSITGWWYVQVDVDYPHQAFAPALGVVPSTATARFTMLTQQQ